MLPSSTRVRYVAAAGATIIVSGGAFTAAQAATDPGATSTAAADANTARPAPYGGPTAAQLSAAAQGPRRQHHGAQGGDPVGAAGAALRDASRTRRPRGGAG